MLGEEEEDRANLQIGNTRSEGEFGSQQEWGCENGNITAIMTRRAKPISYNSSSCAQHICYLWPSINSRVTAGFVIYVHEWISARASKKVNVRLCATATCRSSCRRSHLASIAPWSFLRSLCDPNSLSLCEPNSLPLCLKPAIIQSPRAIITSPVQGPRHRERPSPLPQRRCYPVRGISVVRLRTASKG